MVNWLTKVERGVLWLSLVTLPWQMRVVLVPVFRHDVFLEYSSVALYLTDILIISLLVVWIILVISKHQKIILGPKLIFWSVVGLIVWIWLSLLVNNLGGALGNPASAIWIASKITLLSLFYFYLINRVKSITEIIVPLSIGIFLQGTIAMGQYFLNHSLGFRWLDESVLNPLEKGIPVVIKNGIRQLRAHGLTPHANVLGGYLSMGLLLLVAELSRKKNLWLWVSFLVGITGLFLSFSRTAWIVFLVGSIVMSVYGLRYKLFNLIQLLRGWGIGLILISILVVSQYQAILPRLAVNQAIEQNSLIEREQQLTEFKNIYSQSKIFGVGISQYVANNIKLSEASGVTNDYPQPVHNIFLLILAELGVGGLVIFLGLLMGGLIELRKMKLSLVKVVLSSAWLGMVVLGLTDHYIWDLQQGRLAFWLVLALIGITSYNEKYGRGE
jgi:O-antigen ligase